MKRILITGANSYIGTSFEQYLAQWPEDYHVDTISVRGDQWKNYDFSEYDSVFHVAGIAHADVGHVSEEQKELYYKINTELTVTVAQKAKADGARQFIFMSSAIVYGDSAPIGKTKIITKDTPVAPAGFYGDSKVQAENGLRLLEDATFRVVILRPPMIYGPGSKGNYPVLSKLAQKLPVFPYVKNERSMLYVGNLVEFVRLIVENQESGTFWPQNKEYSNTSELVRMIAEAHGKKIVLVHGFTWALKVLGHFNGLVNKAFGSLVYENNMNDFDYQYCRYSVEETISETEGAT